MRPTRIVSGGQTGADRGGLDAAIALGIPHGGWCPRGRKAEDGAIPDRYALEETTSEEYPVRTDRNVRDSDATVVFSHGPALGGTSYTVQCANRRKRPHLLLDLDALTEREAATRLARWLRGRAIATLNVAGPRESKSPGIRDAVRRVLERAFAADLTGEEQQRLFAD